MSDSGIKGTSTKTLIEVKGVRIRIPKCVAKQASSLAEAVKMLGIEESSVKCLISGTGHFENVFIHDKRLRLIDMTYTDVNDIWSNGLILIKNSKLVVVVW